MKKRDVCKKLKNRNKSQNLSFLLSLIFLIFILPSSVFSISKIDSLEICLVNSNTQNKVNILNELSKAYFDISSEKAIKHAEEAFQLAEEINDIEGQVNAALLLYKTNLYNKKFNEAIINCDFLIKISKKSNDPAAEALHLDNKARVFLAMKENVEAITLFNNSLDLRKKTEDQAGIGDSYNNFANLYESLGDFKSALKYFQQSIDQYRKANNSLKLSYALLQKGVVYEKTSQYEQAIEYLNEALELSKKSDNKLNIAVCYKFLGMCMIQVSDVDKAISYLEKALKEFEALNNYSGSADVNNLLGEIYTKEENYSMAMPLIRNAIQLYEEQMNIIGEAIAEKNMGILLSKTSSNVNSKQYLKKSLEVFIENEKFDLAADVCKELITIYTMEGTQSAAMKYNLMLESFKDSIFRNEQKNREDVQTLMIAFGNLNKDKIIELKDEEIHKLQNREKQNEIIFFTSIGLTIILLILGIILYLMYRNSKKKLSNLEQKSFDFERKVEAGTKDLQTKINDKINAEQTRDLLNSVLEQIEESVIITDLDKKIIYVNNYYEKMTLFSRSEVMGTIHGFVGSGNNDGGIKEQILQTISSGQTWQGTLINKRKDGSLFHETACIFPVRNLENKIKYYAAIKRDISESIITDEVIEKSEAIMNSLLVHNLNSVLLIDPQYNILIFNPKAKKVSIDIFGQEPVESDTILNYVPQEDLKNFKRKFSKVLEGDSVSSDKEIKGIDKKKYHFRIKYDPVETEEGHVMAVLLSLSNISTPE